MTVIVGKGSSGAGISTHTFRDEVLQVRRLDSIHAAGFRHIELLANRPHLDYHDRNVRKDLAEWFRSTPTQAPSLHLPFLEQTGKASFRWISGLAPEARDRQAARDEIKRALELTDQLPVSWVVLHLGIPHQTFSPAHFDYAYEVVDMIRKFSGADVLIENLVNDVSHPERIIEFARVAELAEIRICYDVGHGHLAGVELVPEQIGAVHLNDNDGFKDQHLWPFEGTVDWPRLAAALVNSGFDGPLILEGRDPDLQKATEAIERFQDLLQEARASQGEFEGKYLE